MIAWVVVILMIIGFIWGFISEIDWSLGAAIGIGFLYGLFALIGGMLLVFVVWFIGVATVGYESFSVETYDVHSVNFSTDTSTTYTAMPIAGSNGTSVGMMPVSTTSDTVKFVYTDSGVIGEEDSDSVRILLADVESSTVMVDKRRIKSGTFMGWLLEGLEDKEYTITMPK